MPLSIIERIEQLEAKVAALELAMDDIPGRLSRVEGTALSLAAEVSSLRRPGVSGEH